MSANFNFTSDTDLVDDFVEGARPVARAPSQAVSVDPPLKALPPLVYDFDIVALAPDAAQQAHLDALAALGQDVDDIRVEARWRDPVTATAMAQTSRGVRELFAAAGFGSAPSGVRMAPGSFAAEDESERHEIVMRLTTALAAKDAASFDWGQLDISEFFKANAEASSVRSQPVQSAAKTSPGNKQKVALIGLVLGITLLIVAGLSAL